MNELRRDSFASLLRLSSGSVLDIDAETSNTPKLHALHISDNMAITCADSARTSTKRDWTEVDSGESGDVKCRVIEDPKLKAQLEETQEKLNNARQHVLELRRQLAGSKTPTREALGNLQAELITVQMEKKSLDIQISALTEQVEQNDGLQQRLDEAQTEISALSALYLGVHNDYDQVQALNVVAAEQLYSAENAWKVKQAELEAQISMLTESNLELTERFTKLQNAREAQNGVDVQRKIKDAHATIAILTESNAALARQLANVSEQLARIWESRFTCESELQRKFNETQADLLSFRATQEKKETDLKRAINEAEASKDIAEISLENSLQDLEKLHFELNKVQAEAQARDAQIESDHQANQDAMRHRLLHAQNEIQELGRYKIDLEAQVRRLLSEKTADERLIAELEEQPAKERVDSS